jgi:PmbA protein
MSDVASPELLHDLVAAALKAGADAAEAVTSERRLPVGRRPQRRAGRGRARGAATWACASSSVSVRRPSRPPTCRRPPARVWSSAPWPWRSWPPKTLTPGWPRRTGWHGAASAISTCYDPPNGAAELEAAATETEGRPGRRGGRPVGGRPRLHLVQRWRLVTSHGFDGALSGLGLLAGRRRHRREGRRHGARRRTPRRRATSPTCPTRGPSAPRPGARRGSHRPAQDRLDHRSRSSSRTGSRPRSCRRCWAPSRARRSRAAPPS